ncbi:hypothetical protein [Caminibacter pacificus]|uniref:Uncharacterized protein n=1 Tax=Caminibacter pacificus TaxID=1424653 RepID=A0AAJ4RCA2_9BACT|nr:hypothetical protein [Caminibacter pacificus]NPA87854.1 hypothetical protein [Campylobacterota bacterium]QCI28007.1 hypothetical protein C6V80_03220 [Caminibacter pacificus]ROR39806.1 hypothetical protein EDC58_0781 [Caminibacter pacificus]
MKIKYRKNENWGMLSFRTIDIDGIEELIREKILEKETQDIDILDVKIEIDDDVYIVHVFYAREVDE